MRPRHFVTILVLLALAVPASSAHAGGIVTLCDEAHFLAALAGGGTVTFACSGTITLTAEILIAADTTIDGTGQNVTISGNNVIRVFTVNAGSTLDLNELTVANGSVGYDKGGGVHNNGTMTVSNSTFSGNSANGQYGSWGGGIYNGGMLTVVNSGFSENRAGSGGGIYNTGTVTVTDSTFFNNRGGAWRSGGGGGIHNSGGTVTVANSTFAGNDAYDWGGGGILNGGTISVTNSTFSGNSAVASTGTGPGFGGGIYNSDVLTVTNCTFSANGAASAMSEGEGGGIYNSGVLTVSNSTFSDNWVGFADSWSSRGGGICNDDGTVTVTNSTFSGNRAAGHGGGLYNYYGAVSVSNSTFSGNSASGQYGRGGGIYNYQYAYCTTLTLKNTIVASSTTGSNCNGFITDGGGNLSYPDTTCPGINGDPALSPLQNNGGPTQTMALGPGSGAVDSGNDTLCAAAPVNNLDQRGIVRPQGPHCDMGAVEQLPFTRIWLPTIRSR